MWICLFWHECYKLKYRNRLTDEHLNDSIRVNLSGCIQLSGWIYAVPVFSLIETVQLMHAIKRRWIYELRNVHFLFFISLTNCEFRDVQVLRICWITCCWFFFWLSDFYTFFEVFFRSTAYLCYLIFCARSLYVHVHFHHFEVQQIQRSDTCEWNFLYTICALGPLENGYVNNILSSMSRSDTYLLCKSSSQKKKGWRPLL